MQNRLVELISAAALASVIASGCGSDGGPVGTGGSTGGSSGGAQAGSGGTATDCPAGTACGGDLAGTWKVTSSCLNLSGDMDVTFASVGCTTVPVTGTLKVEGTWTTDGKGGYTDNTTTTGSITFPLEASCLSVSSVAVKCSEIGSTFNSLGWKPTTCSTNASGKCVCSGSAKQDGGIGIVSSWAAKKGDYTASGNNLTTDDNVDYTYCVASDKLTLIPKKTVLPLTGTIVLQKESGAGGQGGGGTGGTTDGSTGGTSSGGTSTGGTAGRGGSGGPATGGTSTGGTSTGGTGGVATGGAGGTATGGAVGNLPCDIYGAANSKCVAAHSTIRALFGSYSGNLYQVKRKSDGTFKDIPVLSPGGFADSKVQDTFCAGTTCTITRVYDQSGKGNYIEAETSDAEDPSVRPDPSKPSSQTAASATKDPLTVGGHNVYSLYMLTRQAYWRNGAQSGMPLGSNPQGIYMVTSGKHVNGGCCFDYGNAATTRVMSGGGTMDALYFGLSGNGWGTGNGSGPWVMADFEGGLFSQGGGGKNDKNMSMTSTYVTAIQKNNGTTEFTLRGADATQGSLATFYKGKMPYNALSKKGAIVLGSGGDCCYSNNNGSEGTFYEGAIVAGYPSDATDDAVQANIVSAGYGK